MHERIYIKITSALCNQSTGRQNGVNNADAATTSTMHPLFLIIQTHTHIPVGGGKNSTERTGEGGHSVNTQEKKSDTHSHTHTSKHHLS